MTDAKDENPKRRLHAKYTAEIELYDRETSKWIRRAKKIVGKIYKDQDNDGDTYRRVRYNIAWSNVQTLMPALYARDPKPEVERRFKDADELGRVASDVLERCVSYQIAQSSFGDVMRQCVQDRLLPGRGSLWIRYLPTIEPQEQDEPAVDADDDTAEPPEKVTDERVVAEYTYWEDYGHNVCRTEAEVWLKWRRVFMTRAQLVKRFGEDLGNKVPLDFSPKSLKDENLASDLRKAAIYELWDSVDGTVSFLSKAHPEILESKPPALDLTSFWPTVKPLYATLTNDSLIPVPDYALYQSQAMELEDLTARIHGIQKALKVVGVYDASAQGLARMLNEGVENTMVPVDKWAMFAEKGGISGAMQLFPVKEIADTLMSLYQARDQIKQDLYEITGIADIIRGNSEPNETATAQQIKGRFAVLRLVDSQTDVQRFARDTIRVFAEIIAENFQPETIKQTSGVKLLTRDEKELVQNQMALMQQAPAQPGAPPPQIPKELTDLMKLPAWEDVLELLKNEVLRNFRIDVETDSTVRTDEDADKASRVEFLTASSQFLEQAAMAGQQSPELLPLLGEMYRFAARGFRAAKSLEPVIDDTMKKLADAAQQPRPDPEQQKLQAESQLEQQKMQMQGQLKQQEMQLQAARDQAAQEAQSRDAAVQAQLEAQKDQLQREHEAQLEALKMQWQAQISAATQQKDGEIKVLLEQIRAQSAQQLEHIKQGYAAAAAEPEKKAAESQTKSHEAITGAVAALTDVVAKLHDQMAKPRKVTRDANGLIQSIQ